jgi:carbonic anhydrase
MNRRDLLKRSALGAVSVALPLGRPQSAAAETGMDPQVLKRLAACTPKDGLTRLVEGNARFAEAWASSRGKATPQLRMQTLNRIWENECQIDPVALTQGQRPFAATLSCADSRVDPSWLFACGSGELFEVRSAGNTAFDDAIASLEFAVSVLGTPLILVMGHSGCGAVQAAMADAPLTPLLEQLVTPIRASLKSGDTLTQAVQGNAKYAARQLSLRSRVLQEATAQGTLAIHSAFLDIGSGVVSLLPI